MNERPIDPNINTCNGQVKRGLLLDVGGTQNSIAAQCISPIELSRRKAFNYSEHTITGKSELSQGTTIQCIADIFY